MKVDASFEAGTYIRERGGRLYIWLRPVGAAYGTLRVSTKAPADVARLTQIDGGGFELFLDSEIERPRRVEITLRRWPWPWRRLRVRGFAAGPDFGGDGGAIWDTHGGGGGNGGGGNGGGNGGGA